MKKPSLFLIVILVISIIFIGCGSKTTTVESVTIHISAAASLTDALNELKEEYSKGSKDLLQVNFASSGTLRKQIEEGAPCDLFISASKDHMDKLEDKGFIKKDSRKNLLRNRLVLIASKEKGDKVTLKALTTDAIENISIGTPDSVPAGKYAQQYMEDTGLWEKLQSKLIFAKDVRQVLQYVDTGNADCGIVYESDTVILETGVVIKKLSEESHTPIVYPAAVVTASQQKEGTMKFYEFLQTDKAKSIFEKYGFTVY